MKVKTLKRRRVWWQFLAGLLLFWILGYGAFDDRSKLLCVMLLAACGAGGVICTLKLSGSYGGKGCPTLPRCASSGRTQYGSHCRKAFVYDDEVQEGREKLS